MKKIYSLFAALALSVSAFCQDTTSNRIISITSYPAQLNFFRDTVSQLATIDIDSTSNSISGSSAGFALFTNPTQTKLYGVLDSVNNGGNRNIYELNPFTGTRKLIMHTNDYFSSLETTNTGRVFGVVGNGTSGPAVSGDIYEFNLATKTQSFVTNTANGNSGEKRALGFNPVDQKLYVFCTNFTNGGSDSIITIDINTFAKTKFVSDWGNIELDGAFYYAPDTFLLTHYDDIFSYYKISTNTVVKVKANLVANQMDATRIRMINSTANASFCAGDSLLLDAIYPGGDYQWYKNGTPISGANGDTVYAKTAGTYKLLANIGVGKAIWSEAITVTQNNLPVVTLSTPQGTIVCSGDSVLITGTSGGTLQWYKNGVAIAGANTSSYYAKTAGIYNMLKTNTNGCSDSASVGKTISISPCTGLTSYTKVSTKVYPNPFTNSLSIVSVNTKPTIEIINTFGQIVYTKQIGANETIDLSTFASGIYTLKIISDSNTESLKIIKQ